MSFAVPTGVLELELELHAVSMVKLELDVHPQNNPLSTEYDALEIDAKIDAFKDLNLHYYTTLTHSTPYPLPSKHSTELQSRSDI